jgi:hypothetical protein
MTYTAQIAFRPAHFNGRCGANIPARWTVDLLDAPAEVATRIYSDGCATREEALADFVEQLRRFGLSGNLRLITEPNSGAA